MRVPLTLPQANTGGLEIVAKKANAKDTATASQAKRLPGGALRCFY
jgi:hypothetical protein